jgi:hypothetical protein
VNANARLSLTNSPRWPDGERDVWLPTEAAYFSSCQSIFSQLKQRIRRKFLPRRLSRTVIGQLVPPQRVQEYGFGGGGRPGPPDANPSSLKRSDSGFVGRPCVPKCTQDFSPELDTFQRKQRLSKLPTLSGLLVQIAQLLEQIVLHIADHFRCRAVRKL